MDLRQQIVEDRVEQVATFLGFSLDEAFLRFAHSLIVGQSLHAFDQDDVVDGGQDKQIDVITIEEDGDSADVWVLQMKHSTSFSSNMLIQMGNGLQWLFGKPRAEVATLANKAFRDKIYEYRSLQNSLGPSNLRIHVGYVTNGRTSAISDEFDQELRSIRDTYSNDVYESFDIKPYGNDELVSLSQAQERQSRQIDAELKIKYDSNNPSLIRYYAQDLKGLICSVPAQEIARACYELDQERLGNGENADCKYNMSTPEFPFLWGFHSSP